MNSRSDVQLARYDPQAVPEADADTQRGAVALEPKVPALRDTPQVAWPKRRVRIWGFAAVVIAFLGGFAALQVWMVPTPVVPVETVAFAPVSRVLGVNGRIAAVHSVDVRSVVTGRISTLLVAEGYQVKRHQILAKVNSETQDAVVRQAVAGLDAALVTQQQAMQVYDRAALLGRNIPEATLEADANAVQSATQEVARQTAMLEQARSVLEDHTIRTPIKGRILTLETEVGQIVTPSIPVATVVDTSDLVIEADVDEVYATQIALGQPAVLQLAGETVTYAGHVSFVSSGVDVATGGLAIKIAFDTPQVAPIGLTVTANIVVDQRPAALSLPRAALVSGPDGQGVFVVRDGAASLQPVAVVEWPATRLIVQDGLAEGDVVIADATDISDGQAVSVGQP